MLLLSGFMFHKQEKLSVHSFFKGLLPATGIGQTSFFNLLISVPTLAVI